MSLEPPEKVRKLQMALHAKAKGSPNYRFYLLYDKVYRPDVLDYAYCRCKANHGSVGVDRQSFADIEAYGVERWLGELAQELRTKQYRPQPVRRVWIPKPDGKQRPLGIPTIRDRVVQTAAALVLEAIFEADLQPEQYAYRSNRGALDAVKMVRALLVQGRTEVVDADLSGYFDSIPHSELMKSVARRVSDKHMLHLIKMWLKAPVSEERDGGNASPPKSGDQPRGTPQGAPISPLLANIYMRRFVLCWKEWDLQRRLGATIVNYADDFVICCPPGRAKTALQWTKQIMQGLKLTLNEQKTSIRRLPRERFDFLGYTFGTCYTFPMNRPYIGLYPSKKRRIRFCTSIAEVTDRRWTWKDVDAMVLLLNQKLNGWTNYYCLGSLTKAYRAVERFTLRRLRQWLRHKHQLPGKGTITFSNRNLYEVFGLRRLNANRRIVSWATA